MDQFDQEIEAATKRAEEQSRREPKAVAAHYDADRDALVIRLRTGADVAFPRKNIQGLTQATPAELAEIEITPSGYSLHFPKLDADLLVPALLEGMLGSRRWMAAQLGAQGGKATSEVKAAAARTNGKRGGRPAKKKALGVSKILAERAERAASRKARRKAATKRKPAKRRA
jgi:hypothetical protein